MSDTKSFVLCLAVGATFATATLYQHCAKASELPTEHGQGVCDMVADAAYSAAVDAGDPLPDGAYEQVMNDCDWGGYSELPLNEQVAADGEPVWPVCKFEGGCVK